MNKKGMRFIEVVDGEERGLRVNADVTVRSFQSIAPSSLMFFRNRCHSVPCCEDQNNDHAILYIRFH
jgi:hypothetical protein